MNPGNIVASRNSMILAFEGISTSVLDPTAVIWPSWITIAALSIGSVPVPSMIVPTNTMIWSSSAVGTIVDCTCVGVTEAVGVVVCISVGTDVVDGGICVGVTVGCIAVGDGATIVAAGETAVANGLHALTRASRVKKMAALPIDLNIVSLPLMVIGCCSKG